MSKDTILWEPDAAALRQTDMYRFMQESGFSSYADMHAWSVASPGEFWGAFATFADVQWQERPASVLSEHDSMREAQFFPGAKLNYAEHLLRRSEDGPALVSYNEFGAKREISSDELRDRVGQLANAMRDFGIEEGDRVAGFMPNCPEAIIAMLATTSLGAVWSSCSPDFGVKGAVDRFGQIEPKLLFAADGYYYNGKTIGSLPVAAEIAQRIPSVRRLIVSSFLNTGPSSELPDDAVHFDDFLHHDTAIRFAGVSFNHPLFILFSSGTTGVPKCIVHGHGGTLLQHLKEHRLHSDIRPGDRLFYFTTCGWMMWNWLVSGLAAGATLILFDGSPFADNGRLLWRMAEQERVTAFGTSAKYLSALQKNGMIPKEEFKLDALRSVLSTGSPLVPEGFDFVNEAIGDVQIASIAGGTDIISCFVLGNPLLPVHRGEIQCAGLGMDVRVFDESGRELVGKKGELVCCTAFPSMPVGFWNDDNGDKYREAYFERFPGVWAHGDFVEMRASGGFVIHGRSDAVLNPGGVRIGTAEIYRQVEDIDEVLESIVVGQNWEDDVRVVLFVRLRDGVVLDDALRTRIRQAIRANTTPRHVPAKILEVGDIPRTKSGKITEIAVRDVIHGQTIRNTDALANPEALEHFRGRKELDEA